MSDPAGKLAYGLHLLRLQQRRLGLSTRLDLRPEFLGPQRDRALELLPVACQRGGSGAKRTASATTLPLAASLRTTRMEPAALSVTLPSVWNGTPPKLGPEGGCAWLAVNVPSRLLLPS